MNSEMKRELAFHPEFKLEIIESYSETEQQIEQVRAIAKEDIDLLIITPNEAKPLTAAIEEIYKSGVPVIFVDRKTDSGQYTAFIGADNYEIGKTTGKFISSQFRDRGNIIELELEMTSSPATERHRGFKDAVADAPNLKIVESVEIKDGLTDINNYLPRILKEHPETNIVFAHTDFLAVTAYEVAQKVEKAKSLFFVGIDALPVSKGMQQVKERILDASLLYPTGGAEAIQTAVKILKKQPFKKENKLLTNVITAENVDIMLSQIEKIKEQQVDIERQVYRINDLNKTYSSQRNRLYFMSALFIGVVVLGTFLFFLLQEKQQSNIVLAQQNDAINRQKDEIEKVSEVARQATEDKMRFYSYISHEFKTPLSLILTPTEDLIERKAYNVNESKQVLELIKKNANRLLKLVDQVLDLRKIDAGKIELNADFYDLVSFSKEIVDDFKFKAKNANIDLQFICPFKELPYEFDAEKLDKVLFNILSNAFKYTPNGGFIHVSLMKNINNVEIKISDNGVGMSEIDRENAFEMFYRANKNVSLGTGLGLALSREFVHLHKGEISVESKKDSGTSFIISLPLLLNDSRNQVADAPVFDHEIETEKVEKSELRPLESDISLVIIEDNAELLEFLNAKFSKLYNVYLAESAEEGWDKILNFVPDLIISDVMLPKQDGFELTQKVKQDFRTSHIPVILLTAKGKIESQIEGTKAGADAYMGKPFNQLLLEEKVKNLIENRDRMRRRFSNEITNPGNVQSSERKFLLDFELLIEKYLNDSTLSVEKLSAELGMSRVQLYRKITAITNHNVNDYIAEYKIKKAKSLLADASKNISEIAYELGFNNPSYFTTFFKQKTNKTPSEWRNT
nr:substrate-binding domain-containing protein [Lacihabitans sp. LS3-19]